MHLAHSVHDQHEVNRRLHANRLKGVDSEFQTPEQMRQLEPLLDLSKNARYPIVGASLQRRGGNSRHDADAWGYARGADARGVDIIQNCEVTGIRTRDGRVGAVETTRGPIGCDKLAVVAAGHSSVVAQMAGFRLPIESFPLQALVSEPVKPCVNTVIMSNAVHGYISQSD
jgi:sarcosine oxidase subunit beta